jgi:hypothetical protein
MIFKLIDNLLRYNSFIWFNRPSRVVYDKKKHEKAWWASEASYLDQDALAQGITRARKK